MMSDLGIAIVGAGNIANMHASALQNVKGGRLLSIYRRSPEKAAEFAAKYKVVAAPSLDSILSNKDIHIVSVCTPSGAHAETVIACLEAGKHVICEKPLDIKLDRIDAMLAASKKNKRHLAGIFQSRFGRCTQILKKAIEERRFGRLTLCDAYMKWWRAQSYYDGGAWRGTWELDGGGALMNQGIHAVDLLQYLVGMPSEVSAFSATLAHTRIEVEDTLVANLRFPNGALGVIQASTSAWPGQSRRIEIAGDKGSAVWDEDQLVVWKFEKETEEDEKIRQLRTTSTGSGASDPMAISNHGHFLQMQDLVDAIKENRAPAIPGNEARKSVQLVLAIYESAKTGKRVSIA